MQGRESKSSAPTLASLGEFGAIERWAGRLSKGPGVRLGIGDDAAILSPLSAPTVTCDALVEGVHFRLDWTSARDLGWKTLAVSLSDLAAMGARPAAAFLSLAAPPTLELAWLDAFFGGLDECARAFACPLAGGDTTRSPGPLFLSLCAVGQPLMAPQVLEGPDYVPPAPLRRDGARVGDVLMATGTLGDSRAGLRLLQEGRAGLTDSAAPNSAERYLLERHFRPTPRLREIARVLEFPEFPGSLGATPGSVTAALDLSDGIVGDAAHIARASGVTLRIEPGALPLSLELEEVASRLGWDAASEALGGGEDYELLLCVRPESVAQARRAIESCGTRATVVGSVQEQGEAPVVIVGGAAPQAWQHF